jgi:hypothetical protein
MSQEDRPFGNGETLRRDVALHAGARPKDEEAWLKLIERSRSEKEPRSRGGPKKSPDCEAGTNTMTGRRQV